MDVTEKLHLATTRQREGQLQEAVDIFQEILAAHPDQPDALHYLGVLLYHSGDRETAIALIEKSLSIAPKQPAALNNLGNMYRMAARDDDALKAYWAAIRHDSGHADSWRNLADIQRRREDPIAAIKSLKIALTFEPDNFSARHWLGLLSAEMGEFDQAAEIFISTVKDDVFNAGNIITYADILNHHGMPEKALELVLEWQKKEPSNPLATHHVAAHSGANSAGASDAYVREIFDGFADTFENTLEGLDYDAPAIIEKTVAALYSGARIGRMVDLGCGTGLLGNLLRPAIDHLTGVDLSPKMLAHAQAKNVYDVLAEGEIVKFLQSGQQSPFELITAAEVLNYIGDLQPVFESAVTRLNPGGFFVGTYETLAVQSDPGYCLMPSGRYAHNQDYILQVGAKAGLIHHETIPIPLRKSFDEVVEGLLVIFRKPE